MIDGKYHKEQTYNRKRIIIDLCDLGPDYGSVRYEVVAMTKKDYIDFDSAHYMFLTDAIAAYQAMCRKYQDAPDELTEQYAQLRDDLKQALAIGKAAETGDDGGTCNFDAPALNLPHWKSSLVIRAAMEAGTTAIDWTPFRVKHWVFEPDTEAQGNDRTRNMEAMLKYLSGLGYDTLAYRQCD